MTKDEALKLAFEAFQYVVTPSGGTRAYVWDSNEARLVAEAYRALEKALAQPEQTNIERHEANVQKFLGAPQPEQDDGMCMACENNLCTAKQGCVALDNPPQPEQEPVALTCCGYADASAIKWNPHNQVVQCHNCGQIYTATPQRTWVGLSVFEINDLVESTEYEDYQDLVERTEAKLMEKNT